MFHFVYRWWYIVHFPYSAGCTDKIFIIFVFFFLLKKKKIILFFPNLLQIIRRVVRLVVLCFNRLIVASAGWEWQRPGGGTECEENLRSINREWRINRKSYCQFFLKKGAAASIFSILISLEKEKNTDGLVMNKMTAACILLGLYIFIFLILINQEELVDSS